jgi:hypothetical protein
MLRLNESIDIGSPKVIVIVMIDIPYNIHRENNF